MWNVFKYFSVGAILSSYFFSFGFMFLPENVNTKMMLAVVGAVLLIYNAIKFKIFNINRNLIYAIILAGLFSVVCGIFVDYNNTGDYIYATYIVSFAVWLFSAYAVIRIMYSAHGYVNIRILTYYLAGVGVAQCILALMIDNIPAFQSLVNSIVHQSQDFLMNIERLYGIGASLDNAGVRFSIILVLIAAMISRDEVVIKNNYVSTWLFVAFLIITGIGCIISRTTIVGAGLGLIYMLLFSNFIHIKIGSNRLKLAFTLIGIILIISAIGTYLYFVNDVFYDYMRFAFEGFFNWAETGKWTTSSTERLNTVMWVWPDPNDTLTWLIGQGTFTDWYAVGTDIGYCRFIFYCGAIGFSIFILFFIYNALVFRGYSLNFPMLYLFLLAITFIVWIKVATDIFIIYALFYCIYPFLNKQSENLKQFKDKIAVQ